VGDEDAWRELVARFSRYVFAICSQAFRLRPADDEAIRPWIGQLTRRLCIDHLRSSSREDLIDPEAMPGGVDEAMATLDEAFAVHEAMAELTENCREILDRFFARDESYQTIGAALEIPSGTIASRISRCLARLREIFEGRNPATGASS
jgi:RNA polymerase sigma-70 factor, ECF subfamily